MAKKIHKLKKGNDTIFPITITDAVVDEETLKTLTEHLRNTDSRLKTLEDQTEEELTTTQASSTVYGEIFE